MADLHDLRPPRGASGGRRRVGRGPGSGLGKTAGRGQDGQKSRSGGNIPADFEGGQMPLQRRIPKRGFHNLFTKEYQIVNVRDLKDFDAEVTPEVLEAAGRVRSARARVKILGEGTMERSLTVRAHAFSATAKEKIEAAGGSVSIIGEEQA